MGNVIRVGDVAVTTDVVLLYAHYLQESVASLVTTDYSQNYAVDSFFDNLLPDPHRATVYRRFVGVLTEGEEGIVDDAFFVPREEVVPSAVILDFFRTLPENHRLAQRSEEDGFVALLRDRLLDAFQFGGLRPLGAKESKMLTYQWPATNSTVTVRFEPDARILAVNSLRYE